MLMLVASILLWVCLCWCWYPLYSPLCVFTLVLVSSLFSFECVYAGAGILSLFSLVCLRWYWYPLYSPLSVFMLVLVSSIPPGCVYAGAGTLSLFCSCVYAGVSLCCFEYEFTLVLELVLVCSPKVCYDLQVCYAGTVVLFSSSRSHYLIHLYFPLCWYPGVFMLLELGKVSIQIHEI